MQGFGPFRTFWRACTLHAGSWRNRTPLLRRCASRNCRLKWPRRERFFRSRPRAGDLPGSWMPGRTGDGFKLSKQGKVPGPWVCRNFGNWCWRVTSCSTRIASAKSSCFRCGMSDNSATDCPGRPSDARGVSCAGCFLGQEEKRDSRAGQVLSSPARSNSGG